MDCSLCPWDSAGQKTGVGNHSLQGKLLDPRMESESRSVVSSSLRSHGLRSPPGILQTRILEWVAHSLLQRIFPTEGSKPGLLYCRWMLYRLSHQGNLKPTKLLLLLKKNRFWTLPPFCFSPSITESCLSSVSPSSMDPSHRHFVSPKPSSPPGALPAAPLPCCYSL